MSHFRTLISCLCFCALGACANVPQEVVDLTAVVSEDVANLQESYRELIKQHYENVRGQRLAYFEDEWSPLFLEKLIAKGRLVEIANGQIVWDADKQAFASPAPGREKIQLLESVQAWSEEAVYQLGKKRKELIDPIDKDEKELRVSVDEAFARVLRGNAVVTAHLNSLRKVQGAQDELLEALKLKDLRVKINQKLAAASTKAELTADEIAKLKSDLDEIAPEVGKVRNKIRAVKTP